MKKIIISNKQAGLRLDAALAENFPDLGLRGRRRLLGNALLNGKPVKKISTRVVAGDILQLESLSDNANSGSLIKTAFPYFFVFKPQGLHSISLAGSCSASLEANLPAILNQEKPGVLLQRLDYLTCGIIAGSFTDTGGAKFKHAESQGRCLKFYLALLSGQPDQPFAAASPIDACNRKKSKILPNKAEQSRWTWFWPLPELQTPVAGSSWAMCMIKRGARHQIRAHAAATGFALVGDELYGGQSGPLCLRHFYINFGDFSCFDLNSWPGAFPLPYGAESMLKENIGELRKYFSIFG